MGHDAFGRKLDALGHRYRRRLLVALSEHNPQPARGRLDAEFLVESGSVAAAGRRTDEIGIVHNHLPKLDNYGYVTWGGVTGDISKGPNWDDIEPVVEFLKANEDELPADWL